MIFTALPRPAGFLLAAQGVRYCAEPLAEEGAYLSSRREVILEGEGCWWDGMSGAALRYIDRTDFRDKAVRNWYCGKLLAWLVRLEKEGSARPSSPGCKRALCLVPGLCSGPIRNVRWWHLLVHRALGSAGHVCRGPPPAQHNPCSAQPRGLAVV